MANWVVGDQVDHDFYVVDATENISKNTTVPSKPYLSLEIRNKYIDCNSKLWDYDQHRSKNIERGCYIHIKGEVKEFNSNLQINIKEISNVGQFNIVNYNDLFKVSSIPLERLKEDLLGYLSLVKNETLCKMNEKILSMNHIMKEFYTAPAATKNHHDCVHGTLEHTTSMMGLCLLLKSHYTYLNLDLLISGCFWHDLGKIFEIGSFNLSGEYTTKGKLLGHMNISLDIVTSIARSLDIEFEYEIDFLRHMIISHHGKKEYGSAVIPAFPEAQFLSMVDDMDAKSKVIHEKLMEINVDEWTARRSNTQTIQTQMIRHKFFNPVVCYCSSLKSKLKGVFIEDGE